MSTRALESAWFPPACRAQWLRGFLQGARNRLVEAAGELKFEFGVGIQTSNGVSSAASIFLQFGRLEGGQDSAGWGKGLMWIYSSLDRSVLQLWCSYLVNSCSPFLPSLSPCVGTWGFPASLSVEGAVPKTHLSGNLKQNNVLSSWRGCFWDRWVLTRERRTWSRRMRREKMMLRAAMMESGSLWDILLFLKHI